MAACATRPTYSSTWYVDSAAPTTSQLPKVNEATRERIARVQALVDQASADHNLDPALINAVIWVESRFQPQAKSPAGARGLMQLMPGTASDMARSLGVTRPKVHDPAFNIQAGSLYLSKMMQRYDGDERLALAAYHAGAGNVNSWLKTGRFHQGTQDYVSAVTTAKQLFPPRREYTPTTNPAPAPSEAVVGPAVTMDDPAYAPAVRPHAEPQALPAEDPPYQPQVSDPPLADTPYRETPDDPPVTTTTQDTNQGPAVGIGILPSVLD